MIDVISDHMAAFYQVASATCGIKTMVSEEMALTTAAPSASDCANARSLAVRRAVGKWFLNPGCYPHRIEVTYYVVRKKFLSVRQPSGWRLPMPD
jgi:hypothetical protein